eukprot:gene11131-gene9080
MGYRVSSELMQLLCSALAGVPSVVQTVFQAPRSLHIDVWIDNIRISGDEQHVRQWGGQMESVAANASVTLGYTFIGVVFDHRTQHVCIGEKALRHLRETPSWKDMR